MDSISQILDTLQLRSRIYLHESFCGNWKRAAPPMDHVAFHLVGRGNCWITPQGSKRRLPLQAGDLLVLPAHLAQRMEWDRATGPDDVSTTLICGRFELDGPGQAWLLQSLDQVQIIRLEAGGIGGPLFRLGQMLAEELAADRPGARAAVERLSDVLFIHVLRWLGQLPDLRPGTLKALCDARIGKALAAFHAAPERAWSVEALARQAAMSRSAFIKRMNAVAGVSPAHYLTGWRMQQARKLLATTGKPLTLIAQSCGYGSDAAFNRAFARAFGTTPARYRRDALRRKNIPT
jgi:AraC-like DNA-binding protein